MTSSSVEGPHLNASDAPSVKGRHRAPEPGVSQRVIGTLSAAVLAGCGIAYFATDHGLLQ